MASDRKASGSENWDKLRAEARRNRAARERSYREKALKLFPHVCGRCGREFSGKRLSELTVHHKDSDHDNNPPDGSNWELLCLYCHDHEHSKYLDEEWHEGERQSSNRPSEPTTTYKAFAGLEQLLKSKEKE